MRLSSGVWNIEVFDVLFSGLRGTTLKKSWGMNPNPKRINKSPPLPHFGLGESVPNSMSKTKRVRPIILDCASSLYKPTVRCRVDLEGLGFLRPKPWKLKFWFRI